MAEAVVEDRPQQPQRFYCHMCSVEIHMVTSVITVLLAYQPIDRINWNLFW